MKYYKKKKQCSLYDARVRYGSLCAKMESLTGLDGLDGRDNTGYRTAYRTMVWDIMRREGFTCKVIAAVSGRCPATVRVNTNAWRETLRENHPGWKREIDVYRRFVPETAGGEPDTAKADRIIDRFLSEAEKEQRRIAGTPEDNFVSGMRWTIRNILFN